MASSSASSGNHGEYLSSETLSRFLMDTVTVTHDFEVTSYSLLQGYGVGQHITSATFSAGGYDWNIWFYPEGHTDKEKEAGYASAYLNLCRGESAVRVKKTLSLLDIDGNTLIQRNATSVTFDFEPADDSDSCWGCPRFFEKPETNGMPSFVGDCFTIRCVLTLMTQQTNDVISTVLVPRSNLQSDMVHMLEDGQGTDVEFIVGEESFHAHRGMLAARSPVFKAELFGQMKEKDAHRIKIHDMEPAIFGALLHFVYTDTILDKFGVDKDASFQHLFVAADRYGLDRLRALCELKLCQGIDVHTVATTLALADQHHCVRLKNTCLGFMCSHGVLKDIQETDGFNLLTTSCPLILGEIVDMIAKIAKTNARDTLDSPTLDVERNSASSETSSRFLTDTVTVTHNFEVTGYSLLDGMGVGQRISSSTFRAGGYDWNVWFYPEGGYSGEIDDYASAFLHLAGGEPAVRVKYTLSLLDMDGNPLIRKNAITHTFESAGNFWGYPRFFQRPEMDGLPPFVGDCFTIRCVLTVITHHTQDLSAVVVPQSDLPNNLADMLKDGQGTDVAFSVGDQSFHAHRWMLAARSSVFKAELFSEMKEKDDHGIKIDDMEPGIFGTLLHFVYTDTILDDFGADKYASFQHLFVAADRYGLNRLRAMSELKLCQKIDVHTVATTLALAEQHHCVELKNECLGFMSSHGVLSAIQETDGFNHLISSCPSILGEIIDKIAKVTSFK